MAEEQGGKLTQYDTGGQRILGVSPAQGAKGGVLRFTSQSGEVELASLIKVR